MCNLQAALDLLQEVQQRASPAPVLRAPSSSKGWLPRMAPATNSKNHHLWNYLQQHVYSPQVEILVCGPLKVREIAPEIHRLVSHQACLGSSCQTGTEFCGQEAGNKGHAGTCVAEQ